MDGQGVPLNRGLWENKLEIDRMPALDPAGETPAMQIPEPDIDLKWHCEQCVLSQACTLIKGYPVYVYDQVAQRIS